MSMQKVIGWLKGTAFRLQNKFDLWRLRRADPLMTSAKWSAYYRRKLQSGWTNLQLMTEKMHERDALVRSLKDASVAKRTGAYTVVLMVQHETLKRDLLNA